ncbi:unnamed protein product [Rotaria sp. Silwood2]|nr:unnamed protein product [Rotaria sp. Silwood2]CAF2763474.1 unnamed protein product [Rotaria sp. Silwood2]CAF4311138.1 unnamed protein product [Rotaria sp. Silwood2]
MEIAACPKVLLLDEPTSGLDTVACDDLFDLLQLIKHSAAGPVTIIMVIHQPSQELYEKIDDIFFLTPLCCLAYQGPREQAKEYLEKIIFSDSQQRPPPRHNDCDTCFIMLTKAQNHIDNYSVERKRSKQTLAIISCNKRAWLPFYYVMSRSVLQNYIRSAIAEATYLFSYFLLGACLGYLFENKQQGTCDIQVLPTIYFLITLAFGILTCISSQRLFGIEITDRTYERESRSYFHPFQYWLAKSLVDTFRLILYPLLFLSMLYIAIVPRGPFSYYLSVMILLSFVCSGIGQLTSVIFNRTEFAYLAGTIIALVSCLLSGFSPTKSELGHGSFIVTLSFSRHIQNLLFRHETTQYLKGGTNSTEFFSHQIQDLLFRHEATFYANKAPNSTQHLWSTSVDGLRTYYSFSDSENPYFWLIFMGLIFRALTFLFLYGKSEYRSQARYSMTHIRRTLKCLFSCEPCRKD